MKNQFSSALFLCSSALIFSGCGLMNMPDKMDKSNNNMDGMKSKMDLSNNNMDGMKSKMDLSNENMAGMKAKMDLSNKNMADMKAKMDQTNLKMDATNHSIYKQTLLIALDDMLKKENSTHLTPVPTGMMKGGETFAKETKEEDLVKLAFLYYKEINELQPDESFKDPKTGKFPEEILKSLDHQKAVKQTSLEVIAGLLSQPMVEEVVETEIIQGGRYEKSAYIILLLRSLFIRDVLLEQSLLSEGLSEIGMMKEALGYTENLEYIAKLPFKDKIRYKTIGMSNPDLNVDLALDLDMKDLWNKLKKAYDTQLTACHSAHPRQECNEVAQKIQSHLASMRQ